MFLNIDVAFTTNRLFSAFQSCFVVVKSNWKQKDGRIMSLPFQIKKSIIYNDDSVPGFIRLVLYLFFTEYLYTILHAFVNVRANEFFTASESLWHYRFGPVIFAAGLLLFGLIFCFSGLTARSLNRMAGLGALVSAPLIFLMFICRTKGLFLLSYYILMPLMALIMVFSYSRVAGVSARRSIGAIFAVGNVIYVFFQFFIQNVVKDERVMLYSILLITFAFSVLAVTDVDNGVDSLEALEPPFPKKRLLIVLFSTIGILILLELIGNFMTWSLLSMFYEGTDLVYDIPRLFFALGFLIMGVTACFRDMKLLPVVLFACVLLGVLNPILFHNDSQIFLSACIYYVFAGAVNSFYILYMWKLARGNRFWALVAVLGCFIDKIFSFIFITPAFSDMSLMGYMGLELLLIVVIMLILVFSDQLYLGHEEPVVKEALLPHISADDFSHVFGFTEKETEIFKAASDYDGTMSELANSLYISRVTLYSYLRRIYEKTGQSSFNEVRKLYYNMPALLPKSNEDKAEDTEKNSEANASPETVEKEASQVLSNEDKVKRFACEYGLTDAETSALSLYILNPDMTQQQLAELSGVTLRTMQRRLYEVRTKTDASSLKEVVQKVFEK